MPENFGEPFQARRNRSFRLGVMRAYDIGDISNGWGSYGFGEEGEIRVDVEAMIRDFDRHVEKRKKIAIRRRWYKWQPW